MTAPTTKLPEYLRKQYEGWKSNEFSTNSSLFRKLADEGQQPPAMIISCCDSRVGVDAIFSSNAGEVFVHRNIAALVPSYTSGTDMAGTLAAVEYAVLYLKVKDILIVGHSGCGGVAACHDIAAGDAPELDGTQSFIGRWVDILKADAGQIDGHTREARIGNLEKQAVVRGLSNLLTCPFVESAIEGGRLHLHGLWMDIGAGALHQYDEASGAFVEV